MRKKDLLCRVEMVCREKKLFSPGDGLVIACSGGVDSVALTDLIQRLAPGWKLRLCIAHFEHGIRGRESAEDAEFVKRMAAYRQIPFRMERSDVPGYAAVYHLSLETAARELRYAFLRNLCRELEYDGILLAHHGDDQAETVLMRLLRGAGMEGLSAMSYKQDGLIRPLLSFRKKELEVYCRERRLSFREDRTNQIPDAMRNRLRLELLPILREKYNPSLDEVLCRLADMAGEEQDFLHKEAERLLPRLLRNGSPPELSGKIFAGLHPAMQRIVLRLYLRQVFGDIVDLGYQHCEAARRLIMEGKTGTRLMLPKGRQVEFTYGWLRPISCESLKLPEYRLNIPGTTDMPEYGMRIYAEVREILPEQTDSAEYYCDAAQLPEVPVIRTRRPGDRIVTTGGTRKLKDYFIDCKLRKDLRERQPLLVIGGRVLWVIGGRRSSLYRPSGNGNILYLKVEKGEI